jgi:hypothetical protein
LVPHQHACDEDGNVVSLKEEVASLFATKQFKLLAWQLKIVEIIASITPVLIQKFC